MTNTVNGNGISFNEEYENAIEELIINNITFTSMPSDITSYATNAVLEDTFMRSKAVFSIRSKYAKGKITLTIPISIDITSSDPIAIASRNDGINLLSQANNYPFLFIKSSRIYSYLGDKAKKSSTGYMMFAVDELKIMHVIDVQDVLFLELSLVYCDHTSQTKDFTFVDDPIPGADTVDNLSESGVFTTFAQNLRDTYGTLDTTFQDLTKIYNAQTADNPATLGSMPLSKVFLFAPLITDKNTRTVTALQVEAAESGSPFEPKVIKITSHFGDQSLSPEAVARANGVGAADPATLGDTGNGNSASITDQHTNTDYLYIIWQAFHDLEMNSDGNMQRITCSRKNKLAMQFIGTHQNPFIQYMGRYPGRVSIDMVFNSGESYKLKLESSLNALNQLSNIIDVNNSQFPEASAYNTFKIRSLATDALNITNLVPNQTSITATATEQGTEQVTITLIETHMEEFMDAGKVVNGRGFNASADIRDKALLAYLNSVKSTPLTQLQDTIIHKGIITSMFNAYGAITSEMTAGKSITPQTQAQIDQGIGALDNFPKVIPKDMLGASINALSNRIIVIADQAKAKANGETLTTKKPETTQASGGVIVTDNFGNISTTTTPLAGNTGSNSDFATYTTSQYAVNSFKESGLANALLNSAFVELNALKSRGDAVAIAALSTTGSSSTIDQVITAQLLNYTGTNIPDINLDLTGINSDAYTAKIPPFFFLATSPYFTSENIVETVNSISEAVNSVYDNVVNAPVAEDTSIADSSSFFKATILSEERIFTAGSDITGVGGTNSDAVVSAPGLPSGNTYYDQAKVPDWNGAAANTQVRLNIREAIRAEVNANPRIPASEKLIWTRFAVQVAGKESSLSPNGSKGSNYLGPFAIGLDACTSIMKQNAAQGQAQFDAMKGNLALQVHLGVEYLLWNLVQLRKEFKNNRIKPVEPTWYDIYGAHNVGIGAYPVVKLAAMTGSSISAAKDVIGGKVAASTVVTNLANNTVGSATLNKGVGRKITGTADDVQIYTKQISSYFAPIATTANVAPVINKTIAMDAKNNVVVTPDKLKDVVIKVKILRIEDGDTIQVKEVGNKNPPYTIRFADIDAPEVHHDIDATAPVKQPDGNMKPTTFKLRKPEQPYGVEATNAFIRLSGGVGAEIFIDKAYATDELTHGRAVKNLYTLDGTLINFAMVAQGMAWPVNTRENDYMTAYLNAKSSRVGLWADSKPIQPNEWRDVYQANAVSAALAKCVSATEHNLNAADGLLGPLKNGVNSIKSLFKPDISVGNTNTFVPLKGAYIVGSPFGDPKRKDHFHQGQDFSTGGIAIPVVAAADGQVELASWENAKNFNQGYGQRVRIVHAAGYKTIYAHLSSFNVKANEYVKAGQVIGMTGNTGHSSGVHLHYEVHYQGFAVNPFMTPLLSSIPAGATMSDIYAPASGARGRQTFSQLFRGFSTDPNNTQGEGDGPAELNLIPTDSRGIPTEYSVFSEKLQIQAQADVMSYMQNFNINTAYPCIKAYITVGNENEDAVIGQYIKMNQYFEITGIQDFKLSCNDDTNPVDLLTLRIANPSFVKEDKYAIAGTFLVSDLAQIGTSLESQFTLDRMVLRAGMKLHIRLGYGNDPNGLKTVFNGSIVDMSSADNYAMDLVCEGFGKELISYYISPEKMQKAGGTFTNSSTPIVFGAAMNVDTISHFGTRLGFWRAVISGAIDVVGGAPAIAREAVAGSGLVGSSVIEANDAFSRINSGNDSSLNGYYLLKGLVGDGFGATTALTGYDEASSKAVADKVVANSGDIARSASDTAAQNNIVNAGTEHGLTLNDYRDPESKRLTSAFGQESLIFGLDLSLCNWRQRVYTNIYAAEIEHIDGEYAGSFLHYLGNVFQMGKEAGYHFMFYNTTPWEAMKEMEHRHPGTMCKPLWYEDRMTMFYGIKEQLYIARDLDQTFMGVAARAQDDSLTAEYLGQRPKRFDVACGFHVLSSGLNIVSNSLGINNKYATGTNILYFEDADDANPNGENRKQFKMVIDDDIASWDMRYKTISMNGCHGRYSAYMYGTQELKRECETMYGGKIVVMGDPTIKAGDYAYLSDTFRKLTGIIKVRECIHTMNSEEGYLTEIVPGQYIEARKFVHSMLFLKLGFAAKAVLVAADISLKLSEVGDEAFNDYYTVFATLNQWTHKKTFSEMLSNSGGVSEGVGTLTGLLILSAANMASLTKLKTNSFLTPFYKSAIALSKNYGSTSSLLRNYVGLASTKLHGGVDSLKRTQLLQSLMAHKEAIVTKVAAAATTGKNAVLASEAVTEVGVVRRLLLWVARSPTTAVGKVVALPFRILASPLVSTVVFGAVRALAAVTTAVSVALMSNPIGWLVDAVVMIVFSYVNMKFNDAEFGRNPLLFFPITHLGRPYVSGMAGYNHNSYWESVRLQFGKNLRNIAQAGKFINISANGGAQSSLASVVVNMLGDPAADAINKINADAIQSYKDANSGEAKNKDKNKDVPTP